MSAPAGVRAQGSALQRRLRASGSMSPMASSAAGESPPPGRGAPRPLTGTVTVTNDDDLRHTQAGPALSEPDCPVRPRAGRPYYGNLPVTSLSQVIIV